MRQQLDWSRYRDYEYCRSMKREYTISFPVHDIPNYPTLFIRDGDLVFVVDKATGEISNTLSLSEYVDTWLSELSESLDMQKYYLGAYRIPKQHPDTARTIQELKELCSDGSRHRKGDTEYLLDFIHRDECTATETKVFMQLCKLVVVWNYLHVDKTKIHISVGLSSRQCNRVMKSLEDKGLIKTLTDRFESKSGWESLIKVHPKLFWKGRYSAWAISNTLNYEYEDALELD